jgi:hypothetical protein
LYLAVQNTYRSTAANTPAERIINYDRFATDEQLIQQSVSPGPARPQRKAAPLREYKATAKHAAVASP